MTAALVGLAADIAARDLAAARQPVFQPDVDLSESFVQAGNAAVWVLSALRPVIGTKRGFTAPAHGPSSS